MKYFFNYTENWLADGETYVFDDHNEEGKLDSKGLLRVDRAGDVVGWNVGAHNFKDRRLNVGVGDSLDVAISNVLVPNLKGLWTNRINKMKWEYVPDGIENWQEAALESALEH